MLRIFNRCPAIVVSRVLFASFLEEKMVPMTEIRLFLFGIPRIERNQQPIDLGLRKALALVSYLAVNGQPQSRDFLAGLLWPESDQTTARGNLRRTLYIVRKKVGDDVLEVSKDNLGISPNVSFWLDVKLFREKFSACPADNFPDPHCRKEWEEAAALYTDDFMAGFYVPDSQAFDEWQFFEREDLRQKLGGVLKQLAQYYLLSDRPKEAIPHARRWLALDHLHEPAHRMLMELYASADQQAAALRQYQECRRLLKEELGITPEAATMELYEAIRSGIKFSSAYETVKIPKTQYVPSGEVHIAFQTLGSGPVDLLIVPGFVSHLEVIWESPTLARALQHLAKAYRVILFDKRGVGLSDRVGYPPTLEHTMDDMLAVLNAVGSKRAVLFGFSEGGPNSLVFCAAHPERVQGLILYGTLAKGMRSADYPWALTEQQHVKWLDWLLSVWGKPVPHLYFAPSRASDHELWEWFAKILRLGSSPGGVQGVLDVLKEIDVRQILSSIHIPVLVMHRVEDRAMRVAAGRYIAENIPDARYVELPGDDHWWWLGDVDGVMRTIEAFISSLKSVSSTDRLLATILCIRLERKDDSAGELYKRLESIFNREIKRYQGYRMRNSRQIVLSTFDGPSRAIQCALTLHRIGRQNGIPFPITLHTGECLVVGSQLSGEALEIAKAALSVAGSESVLVSRTVKDLVVGAGFTFEKHGAISFGNELWEFYQVES
jgi:DNA-binding SARP family transcriptional activator/pimeloyl-ACP methyl ester carboxylesterase